MLEVKRALSEGALLDLGSASPGLRSDSKERKFLRSRLRRILESPAAFSQGPRRLYRDINIRGPLLERGEGLGKPKELNLKARKRKREEQRRERYS